ncbi:tyrosine-type recombinase/integrase [Nocardia colli]|uniref:tyrosine-type recombinase/integrase n=1 Tax=Nocardia colli TaxID=2545717 RepID=UPI00168CFEE0|nr:site-specific integrase [Nocardia colli]
MPTLDEYLPRIMGAVGPGMLRTYRPYWNHLSVAFGTRRLDAITATEIEELKCRVAANAAQRSSSRYGRSARESFIAASRAIYSRAIADDLMPIGSSPAHRVAKPRRLPSTRRALTATELEQIDTVERSSGNYPVLDALLLRLHTETACRRGGALGLRVCDWDSEECLVRLREKGQTVRWQPISPPLPQALVRLAEVRGARQPGVNLLRYRDSRRLTYRRYDNLWNRVRGELPWAAAQGVSTRWLRHTTLTWVERNFGYGVARAYPDTPTEGASTTTYIKVDVQAVAGALAAMTSHQHLLAVGHDDYPITARITTDRSTGTHPSS